MWPGRGNLRYDHFPRRPVDDQEFVLLAGRKDGLDRLRGSTNLAQPFETPHVEHLADRHESWLVVKARRHVRRLLFRGDDGQRLGPAALTRVREHCHQAERAVTWLGDGSYHIDHADPLNVADDPIDSDLE